MRKFAAGLLVSIFVSQLAWTEDSLGPQLQQKIKQRKPDILKCIAGLANTPEDLKNKAVDITLRINVKGVIEELTYSSDLPSPYREQVNKCITTHLWKLQLPATSQERVIEAHYTLNF